ncbi:bifunctional protein NCOAT [Echinococcus multilocularis]|uniref:protein O-GlcNAcase n=1 Tax=Echinococcus multilocularis TaxID=6211 RepID=A0A087W0P6_ECHMU|nr:bifunctional protein NCOAT [Echinococcus multilocularis]
MSSFFFSDDPQRPEPSEFLCGVVEGFYGRPWTYPQRRELFRRMQSLGMNAYLYAPKDDLKHRLSWRELYTDKEAENMRSLIAAADDHNICFIFAISPGSDVVYSDEEDAAALKARLEQALNLGCHAFALLFDDIDMRLCPADQEVFVSPGLAQVALTNKVYEALDRPDVFLFCPTEYCASRAVPNVNHSTYLATLGSDLAEGIKVMWTGPLVVSKRVPTLGIRDLSRLLKRPIVLWDNLHANDYDQRRVFLGPYAGRPLALRRRRLLHGVLTNPNCEFEANYVAIHTLAQWTRIGHPSHADKVAVSADLADVGDDLEREEEGGQEGGAHSSPIYRPREALHNALRDWLALMLQDQRSNSVLAKRNFSHPATPTPMETDSTDTQEVPMQVENSESTSARIGSDVNMGSESTNVVPSLGIGLEDLELLSDLFYLPFSHGPTALKALELGHWLRENSHLAPADKNADVEHNKWCKKFAELIKIITNVSQLREKIQRLPHPGVVYDLAPYLTDITSVFAMLLDYFRWLENGVMANRSQAHLKRLLTWFSPGYSEMTMSGDHEPWMFRGGLITELQRILPLESAQDLFPAPSRVSPTMTATPTGPLAADDLSPCEQASSLLASDRWNAAKVGFQPRRPYLLRPYRLEDKPKIYGLWRRMLLYRLGLPKDALPEKYEDLPGDRYFAAYLERFPQHCLVVEGPPLFFDAALEASSVSSSTGRSSSPTAAPPWDIVAFAFAAPDIGALTRVWDDLRRGQLRVKYPKDEALCGSGNHLPIPRKPSINNIPPRLSVEDFIRISLDWIHDERITTAASSIIAEAAVTEVPPPEPLGAAISEQQQQQQQQPMAVEMCGQEEKPTEKTATAEEAQTGADVVEAEYAESNNGEQQRMRSKGEDENVTIATTAKVDQGLKKMDEGEETRPGARTVEAIHSAIISHPASIFVELDDYSFSGASGGVAGLPMNPLTMMNHHLGVGSDPPELVLDEVARRLFVCLLAGLKTCASHGVHVELDAINETRTELYRRFGFYPVAAASTDFVTVMGRLI